MSVQGKPHVTALSEFQMNAGGDKSRGFGVGKGDEAEERDGWAEEKSQSFAHNLGLWEYAYMGQRVPRHYQRKYIALLPLQTKH